MSVCQETIKVHLECALFTSTFSNLNAWRRIKTKNYSEPHSSSNNRWRIHQRSCSSSTAILHLFSPPTELKTMSITIDIQLDVDLITTPLLQLASITCIKLKMCIDEYTLLFYWFFFSLFCCCRFLVVSFLWDVNRITLRAFHFISIVLYSFWQTLFVHSLRGHTIIIRCLTWSVRKWVGMVQKRVSSGVF